VQLRRGAPRPPTLLAAGTAGAAPEEPLHLSELGLHVAPNLSAAAAAALRGHADVLRVERDLPLRAHGFAVVRAASESEDGGEDGGGGEGDGEGSSGGGGADQLGAQVQLAAPWHLDRLDQRSLPLDSLFGEHSDGRGIDVYVLDSGIRATSKDFGGRVDLARSRNFYLEDGTSPTDVADLNGHGTFVASLAAGRRFGVAKKSTIVSLRIYGANATGPMSAALAAIDHLIRERRAMGGARRAAVASMSFGGEYSALLNSAVGDLFAAGVVVVVAAGNDAADACAESPASARDAVTVAATESNDAAAAYSNHGSCVDLSAPGSMCLGASSGSDGGARLMSGTSMSAPLVAGAAAVFLGANAAAGASAARDAVVCTASQHAVSGVARGTTARLLYVPRDGFVAPTDTASCAHSSGASARGGAPAPHLLLLLLAVVLAATASEEGSGADLAN